MKSILSLALTASLSLVAASHAETSLPPDWQRLLDGNSRFFSGTAQHPNQKAERRTETAAGQKPFAVIVGCADSRTSPELVFDQGIGDLFVVRLAGNIVDTSALGSIEYAVAKLGARLIVVLGHEKCGAVEAALHAVKSPKSSKGSKNIDAIVKAIKPAASSVVGKPGDETDNAVRANVQRIVTRLKTASPLLSPLFKSGELSVVGARYDLDEGKVEQVQ